VKVQGGWAKMGGGRPLGGHIFHRGAATPPPPPVEPPLRRTFFSNHSPFCNACLLKESLKLLRCKMIFWGQVRSGLVFVIQLLSSTYTSTNSSLFSVFCNITQCHLSSSWGFLKLWYTGFSDVYFNTIHPSLQWSFCWFFCHLAATDKLPTCNILSKQFMLVLLKLM